MPDVATSRMLAFSLIAGDGTSVSVNPSSADFSLSDIAEDDIEATPLYNRGDYYGAVQGQRKAPTFSITGWHEDELTAGGSNTVLDAIRKTGAFAGKTTTDPLGVVWMLNAKATVTRPGGGVDTITMTNVRLTTNYSEAADHNNLAISGTVYGTTSTNPITVAST